MLGTWAWWAAPSKSVEKPSVVQEEASGAGQKDGGTVGLGEAAVAASTENFSSPSSPDVLAEDALPEPLPGQTRPDSKGRCPYKGHVSLNGGCWVETPLDAEGCGASGYIMVKDKCYSPALPAPDVSPIQLCPPAVRGHHTLTRHVSERPNPLQPAHRHLNACFYMD